MNGKTPKEDIETVDCEDSTELWVVTYEGDKEVSRKLWKKLPKNPGGSSHDFSIQDVFDDTPR